MTLFALIATVALAGSSTPATPGLRAASAPDAAVVVTAVKVSPSSRNYARSDVFSSTDPSNKVLCRTEELTGSRLASYRVCMTKASWDARSSASGSMMSHILGAADSSMLIPR